MRHHPPVLNHLNSLFAIAEEAAGHRKTFRVEEPHPLSLSSGKLGNNIDAQGAMSGMYKGNAIAGRANAASGPTGCID